MSVLGNIAGPAVLAEGLCKRFGETKALVGVDLVVERAQVLGLLGPNGAGKTTTVRILTTLLQARRRAGVHRRHRRRRPSPPGPRPASGSPASTPRSTSA